MCERDGRRNTKQRKIACRTAYGAKENERQKIKYNTETNHYRASARVFQYTYCLIYVWYIQTTRIYCHLVVFVSTSTHHTNSAECFFVWNVSNSIWKLHVIICHRIHTYVYGTVWYMNPQWLTVEIFRAFVLRFQLCMCIRWIGRENNWRQQKSYHNWEWVHFVWIWLWKKWRKICNISRRNNHSTS